MIYIYNIALVVVNTIYIIALLCTSSSSSSSMGVNHVIFPQ